MSEKNDRNNDKNYKKFKHLENQLNKLEDEVDALCQKVPIDTKGNPRHDNYHDQTYYNNSQKKNFELIYYALRNVQKDNPDMNADDLTKALQNEVELIPDLIDIRDNRLKKIAEKFVAIQEKRIELAKA